MFKKGEIMVIFEDDVNEATAKRMMDLYGLKINEFFGEIHVARVEVQEGNEEFWVGFFNSQRGVTAGLNYIMQLF